MTTPIKILDTVIVDLERKIRDVQESSYKETDLYEKKYKWVQNNDLVAVLLYLKNQRERMARGTLFRRVLRKVRCRYIKFRRWISVYYSPDPDCREEGEWPENVARLG